ncbi:MAG: type II secretion system F family protein [Marivivens sp.]|nr:type II secretion system F family protein [Marivivens sp.]
MEALWENQELVYLVYIGLAVGVFFLVTGIGQLLSRREGREEARSRRLKMLAKGSTTEEVLAVLNPTNTGGGLSIPLVGSLSKDLQQAGLAMRIGQFLWLCTGGAIVIAIILSAVIGGGAAALVGIVVAFGIPILIIKRMRNKRRLKLIHQLPDALDLMARGLKVGHPLNTSIGSVANEMPDPIGTEFGIIFDQVSFGDDLPDAFAEFADRVDVEDVKYLSASIGIQYGTGGDLARVVSVLARVIRNRIAMRNKIRAISSEGRISGYILTVLPLGIYSTVSILSPDFYTSVSDDPVFAPLMAVVVFLVVVNAITLNRLVNFRV